jgi:hypothetical protein
VGPNELERRLREYQDALGPAPRAELLHVLKLPDYDRADRIGAYWGDPGASAWSEASRILRTPERERIGGLARQAR